MTELLRSTPDGRIIRFLPQGSTSDTDAIMPTNVAGPMTGFYAVFLRVRDLPEAEKICKRRHRHWMRPSLYWIRLTL
ncbi:hypothetical protein N005_17570 [Pseudomonas mediterranea CFBP 5447]|nr:hypothetical protein N005_17570 [Pseudomonas mediterranea CFBP 5447]